MENPQSFLVFIPSKNDCRPCAYDADAGKLPFQFDGCPSRDLWTKASNFMFSKDTIFCSGKEAMFPYTVAASGKQEYTCILFRSRCDRPQRRRGMQGQRLQSLWHPGPGTCTMARSNSHTCFDGSFVWGPHSATARWNPLWRTSSGALQRVRGRHQAPVAVTASMLCTLVLCQGLRRGTVLEDFWHVWTWTH